MITLPIQARVEERFLGCRAMLVKQFAEVRTEQHRSIYLAKPLLLGCHPIMDRGT